MLFVVSSHSYTSDHLGQEQTGTQLNSCTQVSFLWKQWHTMKSKSGLNVYSGPGFHAVLEISSFSWLETQVADTIAKLQAQVLL